MSTSGTPAIDEGLLHDLVDGLSRPGREASLAGGIVGCARHAPQPPAHCMRACLQGDVGALATRGCAFLQAAAANQIEPATLQADRCARGFRVAAQTTTIGGAAATLLTGEGPLPDAPLPTTEPNLLGHLETASRLVQRVGQMLEENNGFANEVLQNYEQLNLIFDLTQQIASVTDVHAIEKLLLQRVARLLATETLWLCSPDGAYRPVGAVPPGPRAATALDVAPAAVAEIVDAVRHSRLVRVADVSGRQLIAGPLVRLDDQVDVVLADRSAARGAFQSGDMMLVESVLAFGGQILSNTELHERMRRMVLEVTRALVAAIDKKDHYTSGHSERGGFLTRLTAQELGVPPEQQQAMEWAGLLHDVGKIGIPEEILCKPGKLTPAEFDIIKQHPRMGYEILQPIASFNVILEGVLYHHEYPDGSGYPEGLVGEHIPLVARIVHVVDTFDALTSTRSYRQAFSIDKAIEIIRAEEGTRIDAEVGEAFVRAFTAYRHSDPVDFAARFPTAHGPEPDHAKS
jgi:HD-GYP domain-containing protein (c-di-GMP phosphodiesterase class II)